MLPLFQLWLPESGSIKKAKARSRKDRIANAIPNAEANIAANKLPDSAANNGDSASYDSAAVMPKRNNVLWDRNVRFRVRWVGGKLALFHYEWRNHDDGYLKGNEHPVRHIFKFYAVSKLYVPQHFSFFKRFTRGLLLIRDAMVQHLYVFQIQPTSHSAAAVITRVKYLGSGSSMKTSLMMAVRELSAILKLRATLNTPWTHFSHLWEVE